MWKEEKRHEGGKVDIKRERRINLSERLKDGNLGKETRK